MSAFKPEVTECKSASQKSPWLCGPDCVRRWVFQEGCVSVNERIRHKFNTEVQLQGTGRVIELVQSGCGLSVVIPSKWRGGMESAASDSQTQTSVLGTGSKVY